MAKHYIITNREIINEDGRNEHIREDGKEEARDELRYGMYEFDESNANDQGTITLFRDHEREPAFTSLEKINPEKALGSTKVFSELYQTMKSQSGNGDVLVFIHGFNTDLNVALKNIRTLHQKYVMNPNCPIEYIVLFTWPARSNKLQYRDDARDAVKSGYALGRAFQRLRDFFKQYFAIDTSKPSAEPCGKNIHLLVHSMGNRVLEAMFTELISLQVPLTVMFNQVILVGADIDYDALEKPKPLYYLIDICERVYVYYHKQDKALWISETTKNAFNRLGKYGPKKTNALADDIVGANVSSITDDDGFSDNLVHHWYYYNSQTVVEDITKVLKGEKSSFSAYNY